MGMSLAELNLLPVAQSMTRAHPVGSTPGQAAPRKDEFDSQPLSETVLSEHEDGMELVFLSKGLSSLCNEAQGGRKGEVLRKHPYFLFLRLPTSDPFASLMALLQNKS